MSEPTTTAGRSMLYDWQKRRTHPPTEARQEAYRAFILAIEQEARAAAERDVAVLREAARKWRDTEYGAPDELTVDAELREAIDALANPAAEPDAPKGSEA